MPWFKVDDTLATHAKVVRAGNTAMGLWVRAGAWSASQLTDGFVPADMIGVLGGRPTDARKLVEVGLWLGVDGGYRFHQWNERQPTREETERKREEWRERQRKARTKKDGGATNVRHLGA
jgi:hypothetical protein